MSSDALRDIQQYIYDALRGSPAMVFEDVPHERVTMTVEVLNIIQSDLGKIMKAHGLTPLTGMEASQLSDQAKEALREGE